MRELQAAVAARMRRCSERTLAATITRNVRRNSHYTRNLAVFERFFLLPAKDATNLTGTKRAL
jgi:hypothetical protein